MVKNEAKHIAETGSVCAWLLLLRVVTYQIKRLSDIFAETVFMSFRLFIVYSSAAFSSTARKFTKSSSMKLFT